MTLEVTCDIMFLCVYAHSHPHMRVHATDLMMCCWTLSTQWQGLSPVCWRPAAGRNTPSLGCYGSGQQRSSRSMCCSLEYAEEERIQQHKTFTEQSNRATNITIIRTSWMYHALRWDVQLKRYLNQQAWFQTLWNTSISWKELLYIFLLITLRL